MSEQEAFDRIFKVNKILRDAGFTWKEITQFWKSCIREAVKDEVLEWHLKGYADRTISEKLNIPRSTVGTITANYWKDKMEQKT